MVDKLKDQLARIMKKMHILTTRKKAFLLLISGLVIGVWQGYCTAIGSNLVIPQPKLMFDLMMLSTFVWMLIWTIRKRRLRSRVSFKR